MTQADITQTTTPRVSSPDLTLAASAPRASRAAATVYWAMGLVRRRRGWPKNAGRGEGGGTERTRVGRFMPGRVISFTGNGSPRLRASRKEASPQPAGEITPHPAAYGPVTTTSAKSGKRW